MGTMTPAKVAAGDERASRDQLAVDQAALVVEAARLAKISADLDARELAVGQLMTATQARAEEIRRKLLSASSKADAAAAKHATVAQALEAAEKAKADAVAARAAADAQVEKLATACAAMNAALKAIQ